MGRAALIVALLASAAGAGAAPVPKENDTARMFRIYGTTHDPDKGAEFAPAGSTLRVTVPAEKRLLSPGIGIARNRDGDLIGVRALNAPRVWRDVKGDFTATVHVSFPVRAKVPPKHGEKDAARASAGLVVWADSDHFLTVTRDEQDSGGEPREFFRDARLGISFRVGTEGRVDLKRSGYLRVKRTGKVFESSYSTDGKDWDELVSFEEDLADAVKVGVFAENSYKAPFEVIFDEYTLTQPKK